MTPLSPEEKQQMMSRPGVTQDDIDEYERLNVERFAHDPSLPSVRTLNLSHTDRLAELYRKLYGRQPGEAPGS